MRFLILGRSVRLKKKKKTLKEKEAWYPSITALEPGNNKINMAEMLVKTTWEKDQQPKLYVVTMCIFMIKRTI